MFIPVKQRVALIDKYISYVNSAKEMEGLGFILTDHKYTDYTQYYREMKKTLEFALEKLKENSTNEKLIDSVERRINKVFEDIEF